MSQNQHFIDELTALRSNVEAMNEGVEKTHPLYDFVREALEILSEDFIREYSGGSPESRHVLTGLHERLLAAIKKPATFIDLPSNGLEIVGEWLRTFAVLLGEEPTA